jgi:hypothetical protein
LTLTIIQVHKPTAKKRHHLFHVQKILLSNKIMCHWGTVYYIGCRCYSKDPIECIEAENAHMRCEGWDHEDKEKKRLTGNGVPYTKAVNGICMDY